MKIIGINRHKIICFFIILFIFSIGLVSADAAGGGNPSYSVSKPVEIKYLTDEGGFFLLIFREKIHPSLPEFSFDIYALPIRRGNDYQARNIVITETDTKDIIQEIPLFKLNKIVDYPSTSDWETMGFVIEDMDFDGYKDIRIIAFMPGGERIPYFYWLWNAKEEKFIRNTDLEEITAPVFDPVGKTIRSSGNVSKAQNYDIVYKYVNSVPITREVYLKDLLYLEQMEVSIKNNQNESEEKKNLNNCYKGWDKELNNILGHVMKEATPEKRETLKTEQKNWLIEREKFAKMKGDTRNMILLVLMTKDRTMELIDTFFAFNNGQGK